MQSLSDYLKEVAKRSRVTAMRAEAAAREALSGGNTEQEVQAIGRGIGRVWDGHRSVLEAMRAVQGEFESNVLSSPEPEVREAVKFKPKIKRKEI